MGPVAHKRQNATHSCATAERRNFGSKKRKKKEETGKICPRHGKECTRAFEKNFQIDGMKTDVH